MAGFWVQISEFRHRWYPSEEAYKRATGGAEFLSPGVIDDTMPLTEHPCTGEWFDSKSKFRSVTKAQGCVEVGNDLLSSQPEPRREVLTREERREAVLRSLDLHGHRRD